jgi:heme/copper-type cytochrome/quinol oxidase subunit 2
MVTRRRLCSSLGLLAGSVWLAAAVAADPAPVPLQEPVRRDVTITASQSAYSPSRVEVGLGDIVQITLVAETAPRSFAIDAYRISKRATPGQPVTFEFRADRAGTFVYYCDITNDADCRKMTGELVVTAR